MQAKLKTFEPFNTSNRFSNAIALFKLIKDVTHRYDRRKYYLSLYLAFQLV